MSFKDGVLGVTGAMGVTGGLGVTPRFGDQPTPPTLDEWEAALQAAEGKRPLPDGYGLTRVVEMYEEKLRSARNEIALLKWEKKQLEDNRKYVLGLVNFIRSSAYGIETAATDPDFRHQLEDRLSARAAEVSSQVGIRSAEQAGYDFVDKREADTRQTKTIQEEIEDQHNGGSLL